MYKITFLFSLLTTRWHLQPTTNLKSPFRTWTLEAALLIPLQQVHCYHNMEKSMYPRQKLQQHTHTLCIPITSSCFCSYYFSLHLPPLMHTFWYSAILSNHLIFLSNPKNCIPCCYLHISLVVLEAKTSSSHHSTLCDCPQLQDLVQGRQREGNHLSNCQAQETQSGEPSARTRTNQEATAGSC